MQSYRQVHDDLPKARGKASEYKCDHCTKQAKTWAYNHMAAEELIGRNGSPYSEDTRDYLPLCRSCHTAMDQHMRIHGVILPSDEDMGY